MEEKIKYIRGVKGRGEEIKQMLKEMGAKNRLSIEDYEHTNGLYFVDHRTIIILRDISALAKLLIAHGEEIFLEKPIYKFKKDDKVVVTDGLSKGSIFRVISREKILNQIFYKAESLDGSTLMGFAEDWLKLYWKFNNGDRVKITKGDHMGSLGEIYEKDEDTRQYYIALDNGVQMLTTEDYCEPYDESQVKTWKDLIGKPMKGFFNYSTENYIEEYEGECKDNCMDVATSRKVVKSMLAMAQISQLMPFYGNEVTDEEWEDVGICKYCVSRYNDRLENTVNNHTYKFVAFHTEEQRDEFLSYPENVQLVKDFYGLSEDEENDTEDEDDESQDD